MWSILEAFSESFLCVVSGLLWMRNALRATQPDWQVVQQLRMYTSLSTSIISVVQRVRVLEIDEWQNYQLLARVLWEGSDGTQCETFGAYNWGLADLNKPPNKLNFRLRILRRPNILFKIYQNSEEVTVFLHTDALTTCNLIKIFFSSQESK